MRWNTPSPVSGQKGAGVSGQQGVGAAGLSDQERIALMQQDELISPSMGSMQTPMDRDGGGTVMESIGQLLEDEDADENREFYGENAAMYDVRKPQGSAFYRPGEKTKKRKGKKKGGEAQVKNTTEGSEKV